MSKSLPKLLILSPALFFFAQIAQKGSAQEVHRQTAIAPSTGVLWQAVNAEHFYGLPDAKPKSKGTLTLDEQSLTFTSKHSNTSIPREQITAVSAGQDRVELWGTTGRVLRMVMPNGSGIAAGAVMHHRVDMLTVEYGDTHQAIHSAVFELPAEEAEKALKSFGVLPVSTRPNEEASACGAKPMDPRGVYLDLPDWSRAEVPAAYRGLVYEHTIERLKKVKDAGHIYRQGEMSRAAGCPQYRIHIAVSGYKKGNQVLRSSTGPIGLFVGSTQMTFDVAYDDAATNTHKTEQIKATVRSQGESTDVADAVAKKLSKEYGKLLKESAAAPKSASVTHS